MLFKITSTLSSKFPCNVARRSYQRCATLQDFYSSLKKAPTYNVAFMPTAESVMTRENIISGWYDARITSTGKMQARCAGHLLMRDGYHFDVGFCSVMSRDLATLCHLYQEIGRPIDVHQQWYLNPQAMGEFTAQKLGNVLNKKYGIDTVDDALLKYTGIPPEMSRHHLFYEIIRDDARYEKVLPKEDIPLRESLPRLQARVLPYWIHVIGRQIKLKRKTIVVADETVLRVLLKYLDDLSDEETMKLNIRKAIPFVYTLDHNLKPIKGKSMQYLDHLVPIKLNKRVIDCPTLTDAH